MKKKTDDQYQTEDWKAKYLRALADYQNLEKREAREKAEIRTFAAEVVVMRFLPVFDTLMKAKAHLNDPGLDFAYKEFESAFAQLGVVKLDVLGKQFNPHEMECIEVIAGEDNIVMEELLPGYTLHGKIIRVAHVKVGKKEA